MLFHCQFTWFPGTTRRAVAQRVVAQHDAGANHPERIKGWYNLVGGGAGFLLVEYDNAKELTAFLQPYMDLMSFDVRAITQLDYDDRIAELRLIATSAEADAMASRLAPDQASSRQLAKKDLSWANLSGSNLARADLRRTNLRNATAIDVDLTGADLSGADLSEANLTRAHLQDARLVDAKLQDTDLRGADLTGAEVPDRSKLDQARLEGAQGLPDARDEGMVESESTGGQ